MTQNAKAKFEQIGVAELSQRASRAGPGAHLIIYKNALSSTDKWWAMTVQEYMEMMQELEGDSHE